jgi:hypothetical protein
MKAAYNAYCLWLERWKKIGKNISHFDDTHEECFQAGYIAGLKDNSPEELERKKKAQLKIKKFLEKKKPNKG